MIRRKAKSVICLFMAVLLLFSGFITDEYSLITVTANAANNTNEFAGGSGTYSDPYLISSIEHFENVYKYPSSYFKMIADIYGKTYSNNWNVIGSYSTTGFFTGVFDGNGYTIYDLDIIRNSSSGGSCSSIFETVKGVVKNLTLKNCSFSSYESGSRSTETSSVGVTACSLVRTNVGIIYNCSVEADVVARTSASSYTLYVKNRGAKAGGIAMYNSGTINNCEFTGSVSAEVNVTANMPSANSENHCRSYAYAGGVLVTNEGKVVRCSNKGTVSADVYHYDHTIAIEGDASCGGIAAGQAEDGEIRNCLNAGHVSATTTYKYTNEIYNCGSKADYAGIVTSGSQGLIDSCCMALPIVTKSPTTVYTAAPISSGPKIRNCYYRSDEGDVNRDENGEVDDIITTFSKTYDDFVSGEVAYCLNGCTNDLPEDAPWYQNIGENGDEYPVLDSSHSRVYTAQTCDTYSNDKNDLTAEHLWTTDDAIVATCTKTGLTEGQHCSVCGLVKIPQEVVPAVPHNYISEVIKESTCTEKGSKLYTCSDCGDFYYQTLNFANHKYEVETVVLPTCTETGYTIYACSVCEKTKEGDKTSATGHSYGEWVEIVAPTCSETGTKKRVCDNCTAYQTSSISKLAHDWEWDYTVDVEPTCTEDGSKSRHCKNCDAKTNITVIEAYCVAGDWVITKEKTCTTDGYRERRCINCNKFMRGEYIDASHEWESEYTVDYVATCTTMGRRSIHCKECDDYKSAVYSNELGHKAGDWTVTEEATCEKYGRKEQRCETCNYLVSSTSINPKGHSYETKVTKDATCTENGVKESVCTTCGDKFITQIPAGHTKSDWIVVVPRTKRYGGEEIKKCTVCGTILNERYTYALGFTADDKVYSVSIDSISMKYKDSVYLNPVIDIADEVYYDIEYTSSDSSVASVDSNGNIYASGKGNATITCTVTDEFGNVVSDTCDVEVNYSFGQWLIIILLFGWIWY